MSNHLGNVLAVVNDKLDVVCEGDTVSYFNAEVMYAYDYSPFGAILEDRKYVADTNCITVVDYDTAYNDHYEVTFTLTTMLTPGQTIRLDNGGGTTKTLATYNAGYVSIFSYKGQIISNVSPAADGIMYIPQTGATVKLRFSADSLGFQCGDVVYVYSGATSLTSVTIDCAIDSIYAVDTIISCSSSDYRFGFNGMEKDNSVKGTGNSYDFGARIYDSRLGRWMSLDPLMAKYPDLSPYCFGNNNPIFFIDYDGRDIIPSITFVGSGYYSTILKVINQRNNYSFTQRFLNPYTESGNDLHLSYYNIRSDENGIIPPNEDETVTASTIDVEGQKKRIVFNSYEYFLSNSININYGRITATNLTEIATVSTFYHEILHTYIKGKDDKGVDEHNEIANNYINILTDAIQQYAKSNNINIGKDEKESKMNAEMLAWQGLEKTDAYKVKFGVEGSRSSSQQKSYDSYINVLQNLTFTEAKEITAEQLNKEISIEPSTDKPAEPIKTD